MQELKINFPSDGLDLEGWLALPETSLPCPGVVLCHPHPLYGGNMDNTVILTVSRALAAKGMAALRFNFRSVGDSRGGFSEGIGEVNDAQAALSFLAGREEIDRASLGIMGYSFGGMIAISAGRKNELVKALAGVSPVIPGGALRDCLKPLLIVYGTDDDVVPPPKILEETKNVPSVQIEAVSGADHFWWGYETRVAAKVADFFSMQIHS